MFKITACCLPGLQYLAPSYQVYLYVNWQYLYMNCYDYGSGTIAVNCRYHVAYWWYAKREIIPRPYVMKEREIEWTEGLKVIYHKPKAATYAWIYSVLPTEIKTYLAVEDLVQRKKRIGYLLKWISEGYDITQINLALEETSVHLHNQEGIMYHALYHLKHPELTLESLTEDYTPTAVRGYEPDLEVYNQLSNGGDFS
jgi:hypothetical protein